VYILERKHCGKARACAFPITRSFFKREKRKKERKNENRPVWALNAQVVRVFGATFAVYAHLPTIAEPVTYDRGT